MYILIYGSEDGKKLHTFTDKEQVNEFIEEYFPRKNICFFVNPSQEHFDYLNDMIEPTPFILIKGDFVSPIAVEKVTKWEF